MSYTYLRETGAAYLGESLEEIRQYAPWKSTNHAEKLCFNGSEIVYCRGSQFGTTLKHSTDLNGEELPKEYQADFLAQIFRQPEQTASTMESKKDLAEKVLDCGLKWRESLKKYNLNLCVLKTPQTFGLKDLCESSKDLAAWGIMQNGECFNVATSAQTISEEGFLSLLPTPVSHNAKEGAYPAEGTRKTPSLAFQIGGKINPDWNEWRMGCPDKWSDLKPLEIDKFLSWLRLHGKH
jgi:hypothetical protein